MPSPISPLSDAQWEEAQRRWQSGEAARQIVRAMHLPVSPAAIGNKARRKGWQRLPGVVVPTGRPKIFEAKRETILGALRDGCTLTLAATCAGISREVLANWRTADAAFYAACEEASAQFARRHIKVIAKAGDNGDYKASQWIVGRHRLTREEYGETQKGGGSPTIVLNICRDQVELQTVSPIIPALEHEEG